MNLLFAPSRGHWHLYLYIICEKICDIVFQGRQHFTITKGINFRRKFCARSFRTYEDLSFRHSHVSNSRTSKQIRLRQHFVAFREHACEIVDVFTGDFRIRWKQKKRNTMEIIMVIITYRRFTSFICIARDIHYYLVNNVMTISG